MRASGALLACLAVAAGADAARGDTVVDGWTVKPFVIDGKFDRCNANAPSKNLGIVLFKDGRVSALIVDPQGTYHEAQIELDIDIDGKVSSGVPAVVVTDQLLLVALGKAPAAIDQLSKASTLRVKSMVKTYTFDISKLARRLVALQKCAADGSKANP